MLASHASSRDDMEVSIPELDALVEALDARGRARRPPHRRRLRRLRRRARPAPQRADDIATRRSRTCRARTGRSRRLDRRRRRRRGTALTAERVTVSHLDRRADRRAAAQARERRRVRARAGTRQPHRRPHRLPGRVVPAGRDRSRRARRVPAARRRSRVVVDSVDLADRRRSVRPHGRRGASPPSRRRGRPATGLRCGGRLDGADRIGALVERGVRGRDRARRRRRRRASRSTAASSRCAAQEAEHVATGVPCGVMDQMASVFGRADHALLLDCRTLTVDTGRAAAIGRDRRRAQRPPAPARGERVRRSGAPRARPRPRASVSRRCATRPSRRSPTTRSPATSSRRTHGSCAFVDALARRRPRARVAG